MKSCSISECGKIAKKRGWCETHYRRWRIHGDPHKMLKRANGDGFIALGYRAKQINGVKKFDHVVIAETVLDRPLPANAVLHHVNENKLDNTTSNLVICPNRAYHNLIHSRMRALSSCGNADWLWCNRCKKHFPPEQFRFYEYKSGPYHKHTEMGLNRRKKCYCT